MSDFGGKDRREARRIAVGMLILVAVVIVAAVVLVPSLAEFNATALAPGVGLQDAALISFFVTIVVLVIFAITAGDGLLGEIQFMIAGFFSFFLIFMFMIAWIF